MPITIPATGSGDNLPIVATDSVAGVHYQQVKLIDSNAGSTAPLATSANPLFARFAAPQSIVGSEFVQGDVPHDSPDAGNPVKMGAFAVHSAWPSAVGSGDRVNLLADHHGRLIVVGIPHGLEQQRHNDFTGPLSGTVVWSGAPGTMINVTNLRVFAGSGTAGIVTVYFAASGAPINFTVGSGLCLFRAEMAPTSTTKPGVVIPYGLYPSMGEVNDAIRISLTTTMQVYVQVNGYEHSP